jgi:hypothetical protein
MRDIKALAFVCSLIAAAACATSGGDGGGGDDGPPVNNTPVCGDAVCAASEVGSCSQDCGTGMTSVCGNSMCEGTEPTDCPTDCAQQTTCGNATCEAGETMSTCPADCTTGGGGGNIDCDDQLTQIACVACLFGSCTGVTEADCLTCVGLPGTGGCVGGIPNGVCDAGEDANNCQFDCM